MAEAGLAVNAWQEEETVCLMCVHVNNAWFVRIKVADKGHEERAKHPWAAIRSLLQRWSVCGTTVGPHLFPLLFLDIV